MIQAIYMSPRDFCLPPECELNSQSPEQWLGSVACGAAMWHGMNWEEFDQDLLELESMWQKERAENERLSEDHTDSEKALIDDVLVLKNENERLRALILKVERKAAGAWFDHECLWCREYDEGHAPDCPAFSAPGVVR